MGRRLLTTLIFMLALGIALAPDAGAASRRRSSRSARARQAEADDEASAPRKTRANGSDSAAASSLALFHEGEEYRRAGNFTKAEACFIQAYEKEEQKSTLDPPTWRRLVVFVGLAHQNNKELNKAVELFRQAIAKDPKYPLFHYFLATSLAFIEMDRANEASTTEDEAGDGKKARAVPDEIFNELQKAYQLRDNLIPGEKIPNPRTDIFLSSLRHDPRFVTALSGAGAAAAPDLEADLAEMIKEGEDVSPDIQQAIIEEIEANPAVAANMLLRRVADPLLTEKQRAGYIWALGRSGDPRGVVALTGLLYRPENAALKGVILEALSRIGGRQAGDALVLALRDAKEDNDRFALLTLLATMQYEPALPLMLDLLGMDSEQAANQMLFCFGKMGEKAMPLLLTKAYDENKTVRINAVNMLRWIGSSRAMIPLQKELAEEKDPEMRLALLEAIEGLMRPDQFETFLKSALTKETDAETRSTMQERLGKLKGQKEAFEKFKADKADDRSRWRTVYDDLYRSYGRAGSLADVARLSTARDESELARLRARVLDRQSPECFRDYMKITRIIAYNRMLGN